MSANWKERYETLLDDIEYVVSRYAQRQIEAGDGITLLQLSLLEGREVLHSEEDSTFYCPVGFSIADGILCRICAYASICTVPKADSLGDNQEGASGVCSGEYIP